MRHGAQAGDLLGLLRGADRALDEAGRRTGRPSDARSPRRTRRCRTRSAIASSSSSRSRSVSWQPSHEANLTTPMRGRRGARRAGGGSRTGAGSPSQALPSEGRCRARQARRPGRRGRRRTARAGSGRTVPTPQAMFRSRVSQVGRGVDARGGRGVGGRLHHPLGAADEGGGPRAVPAWPGRTAGSRSRRGRANPAGPVDDLRDLDVAAGRPGAHLVRRRAGRAASARRGRGGRRRTSAASREERVDQRAERGQADPAGDDHDVAAGGVVDRPAAAERAAQRDLGAGGERGQGARSPGPRRGSSGRGRPGGIREIEIGGAAKAGSSTITNWPGSRGEQRRIGRRRGGGSTVSTVSR